MRWEDERYVKVYIREEPEWTLLPFESRLLWADLMKRFDRAGLLPLGRARWRGLASVCRVPLAFVEAAMPALLTDGCCRIVLDDGGGEMLFAPNYLEAQEAAQSDAARQRAHRERARDQAHAAELGLSIPGEPDDIQSRPVTSSHSVLSLAAPSLDKPNKNGAFAPSGSADPGIADSSAASSPAQDSITPPPNHRPAPAPTGVPASQQSLLAAELPKVNTPSEADLVFARYLAGWRLHHRSNRSPVMTEARRKLVARRLRDGFTATDLLAAADGVWRSQWHLDNQQTGFDLVFRDAAHVERFRDMQAGGGGRIQRSALDEEHLARTQDRAAIDNAKYADGEV